MNLAGLALRNVFRNKRRSVLNTVAIGLGVALMFVCLGWVQGYATYIYKAIIASQTGSAQVLHEGYQAQAARFPLDLTVDGYTATRAALLDSSAISGAGGRIDFLARIVTPSGASVRLLGQGIDAEAEAGVSVLPQKIAAGSYLESSQGILLGAGIAKKLGVSPGATIIVSAIDRYGVENRVALTLTGLFTFGYGALDDSIAYVDLASTRDLLDLGDEVTRIVLAGSRPDSVLKAASAYASSTEGLAAGLQAYSWQEFARAAVSGVETDTYSFYVVAVILFALIIVGILNSMSMSVHERYREIATLRAIGFRIRDVRRLILLEGVALAVIGTAAGMVVAAPVAIWLGGFGVDIASYIPKDFPVPFGEVYHADYRIWHALLSAALGIGSSLAGAMLPARRASALPIAATIGAGL
jgi:putative ABC transport system permease protein